MARRNSKESVNTPRRRLRGPLLALLLGTLFSALAAEVILRFAVSQFGEHSVALSRIVLFPRYVQDVAYGPFEIRHNIPNSHYFHTSVDGRWEFRINTQGFRADRDHPFEKRQGTIRIAAIGDSVTAGYEVRQEYAYPAIIERYLKKQAVEAEVLNAGVSGFSTAEELVMLEHYLVRFDLDYVVLAFYRNDYDDNIKADLFELRDGELVTKNYRYTPGIRVANFLYRYTPHPWFHEHSYAYTYVYNVLYQFAKRALLSSSVKRVEEGLVQFEGEVVDYQQELALALIRRIREVCHSHGIELILMDIPTYSHQASLGKEVALDSYADFFIDGRQLLNDYVGVTEVHVPHGHRHLNEMGHLVLGLAAGKLIERREAR